MTKRNAISLAFVFLSALSSAGIANAQTYCHGGAAAPIVWTDPAIVANSTPIKAIHINELRVNLNAKRVACLYAPTAWSEAIAPNVTPIKKQHIDEIRASTNNFITQDALAHGAQPVLPVYTDANLIVGTTPIKAVHLQDLRAAIAAVQCNRPMASSSFAATETKNGALIFYSNALWNQYKFWLIAQFAAMRSDISGYDFAAMASQFNSIAPRCMNIGDNDPGLLRIYNVNGMTVNLNIRWTGLELVNPPGVAKCEVVIEASLVGNLNGWTCP